MMRYASQGNIRHQALGPAVAFQPDPHGIGVNINVTRNGCKQFIF